VTDDYGMGQSAVVPLKITLIDANDNAPKFTSDTYQSIIDEGASAFDPPLFVLVSMIIFRPQIIFPLLDFSFNSSLTNNFLTTKFLI